MSFTLAQADVIIGVTGTDKLNAELKKTQGQLAGTAKETKQLSDAQKIAAEITNRNISAQDKYNKKAQALRSLKPHLDVAVYNKELENLQHELAEGQAWETHVANVRKAKAALDSGSMSQKQFDQAVNKSNMELRRAQAHLGVFAGGSSKAAFATGKLGFMMQQASFGAQDFVQVYGQTGLSGALRASMNNWAQVLAIMNPMIGAFGGLALTAAGIAWANYVDGADSATSASERLKKATDDLNESLDFLNKLSEVEFSVSRAKTVAGIDDRIKELESTRKIVREPAMARAAGRIETARRESIEAAIREAFPEFAVDEAISKFRAGKDFGRVSAETLTSGGTELERVAVVRNVEKIMERAKELEKDRVEEARKAAGEEKERLALLDSEITRLKERKKILAEEESAALRARFDNIDAEAVRLNQEKEQKKMADDAAKLEGFAAEAESRAFKERKKERDQRIKDVQRYARVRAANDPTGKALIEQIDFNRRQAGATDIANLMAREQLKGAMKEIPAAKEAKSSFVGIEALSKQIQMALNPTAQEKREAEKIKLAKKRNELLQKALDKIPVAVVGEG